MSRAAALGSMALVLALAAGDAHAQSPETRSTQDLLWQRLERQVDRIGDRLDGVMGVAILDLADHRLLLRNADQVYATASSIKLPLMIELYRQEQRGRAGAKDVARLDDRYVVDAKDLVEDSYVLGGVTPGVTTLTNRDLAQLMVAVSDNSAFNILYARVGRDDVNAMLRGLGLERTQVRRRMMDLEAARRGDENVATPREMVLLLQALHDGKLLDAGLTEALLAQLSTTKKSWLPQYLPEDVRVANKPGELGAVRNDVGIVFAPGRPFAIAVMTAYVRDEREAERAIGHVALAAYRYFERIGKSSEYGRVITRWNTAEAGK